MSGLRTHHLNCGTCCPLGGRLFDGATAAPFAHIVCHCLLLETDRGLALVDTGFGARDVAQPSRLSGLFRAMNNIQLREADTALAQVRALGFDPRDVRHIVLTHLDFDHAGGLEDFPHAKVHALRREHASARAHDGGLTGRERYRDAQWDEIANWALYDGAEGEPWFGFGAVRDLDGLPPDILLVPLPGHTWGHCGVAIDRGEDGWLLHAGDAYFYHGEVGGSRRRCPPGMEAYQTLMEVDRAARLRNQTRLRELSIERRGEVRIFCAHDRTEYEILHQANGPNEPARAAGVS